MDSCADAAFFWVAPVARWIVLQDDPHSRASPDVSFVEAALRRRLSPLAKLSLRAAHECAGELPNVRIVYASRHGDLARTTAMLFDLTRGQELSPTAFSMSVLNASAGVYSIAKTDRTASTAISAAQASFGWGLLEASLQLASGADTPVLLIYADEPAPAPYGTLTADVTEAQAIGLLLDNGAPNKLVCQIRSADAPASAVSQSSAFLSCLDRKKTTATWHGEGKTWTWNLQGQ